MNDTVRVKIENSYACGRHTIEYVELPAPKPKADPFSPEWDDNFLDDWWDEAVQPLTGDGHQEGEGGPGCRGGSREHAYYGVEIVAAPDLGLVGETYSWEG